MILPTKGVTADRALLTLAGQLFVDLAEPATVSRLWTDVRKESARSNGSAAIGFDWFVLAVDLAFTMGVIEFDEDGLLRRSGQ